MEAPVGYLANPIEAQNIGIRYGQTTDNATIPIAPSALPFASRGARDAIHAARSAPYLPHAHVPPRRRAQHRRTRVGHKRKGLERLYNVDEAWQLRCDASAKVSDNVAALLRSANVEGKIVAIPARS